MGILSYLKLAGAVVVLGVLGYFYLNYQHLQNKVVAQQIEIDNLKVGQKVMEGKQEQFEKFMAKKTTVTRRVTREQTEITKDVGTIDNAGLDKLYERYRVRPQSEVYPPAPRRKGSPKNPPAGSP